MKYAADQHLCSALGGTRTPNLLIRSQMLSPAELPALAGQTSSEQRFRTPISACRAALCAQVTAATAWFIRSAIGSGDRSVAERVHP